MYCKCHIVRADGVLFPAVAGAVLGSDEWGKVEGDGGRGVTEKAYDIEGRKRGSQAVGGAPADVEEGLRVERGGPGQGAKKFCQAGFFQREGREDKSLTRDCEGRERRGKENITISSLIACRGSANKVLQRVKERNEFYREMALRNRTCDGENFDRAAKSPGSR